MYLLAIVGVTGVSIIAGIVAYQFIQQQQDRQVAIDLVNKQKLQEENHINYQTYLEESIRKCDPLMPPQNDKCNQDLRDKYQLDDKKYDLVDK